MTLHPIPSPLRLWFCVRYMLSEGHYRLAAYASWRILAMRVRWVFMPKRALRMVLEKAREIEVARRRRADPRRNKAAKKLTTPKKPEAT